MIESLYFRERNKRLKTDNIHFTHYKYMTKKPAMEINTSSHLDLMLIRKVTGYEQNDKIDARVPIYQAQIITLRRN